MTNSSIRSSYRIHVNYLSYTADRSLLEGPSCEVFGPPLMKKPTGFKNGAEAQHQAIVEALRAEAKGDK